MEILVKSKICVSHRSADSLRELYLRCDKMSLSLEEVRVPDAQETTEKRNVLLEGSLAEVLVHGVSTSKELVEVVETNVEGNAQTNGAPDGIASTNPAFEAEHVLLVDTELGNLLFVGGESNKVLGNVSLVLGLLEEPGLGSVGVGGGLGRGEGLGGDQEEGRLGVGVLEGLGDVSAVNVGNEVQSQVIRAVVLESLSDHDGTARAC